MRPCLAYGWTEGLTDSLTDFATFTTHDIFSSSNSKACKTRYYYDLTNGNLTVRDVEAAEVGGIATSICTTFCKRTRKRQNPAASISLSIISTTLPSVLHLINLREERREPNHHANISIACKSTHATLNVVTWDTTTTTTATTTTMWDVRLQRRLTDTYIEASFVGARQPCRQNPKCRNQIFLFGGRRRRSNIVISVNVVVVIIVVVVVFIVVVIAIAVVVVVVVVTT